VGRALKSGLCLLLNTGPIRANFVVRLAIFTERGQQGGHKLGRKNRPNVMILQWSQVN